jgi:hypothetical protein
MEPRGLGRHGSVSEWTGMNQAGIARPAGRCMVDKATSAQRPCCPPQGREASAELVHLELAVLAKCRVRSQVKS